MPTELQLLPTTPPSDLSRQIERKLRLKSNSQIGIMDLYDECKRVLMEHSDEEYPALDYMISLLYEEVTKELS